MEVADQPECYVWNDPLYPDQTVTWTGECSGGLAQGTGTLAWVRGSNEFSQTGLLQDGKKHGDWVTRFADGNVYEARYVNGVIVASATGTRTRESPTVGQAAEPGRGQGPECTRQRLIGLGVLNSSIRPATMEFTSPRMIITTVDGPVSTRQELEYNVTADAINVPNRSGHGNGDGFRQPRHTDQEPRSPHSTVQSVGRCAVVWRWDVALSQISRHTANSFPIRGAPSGRAGPIWGTGRGGELGRAS